MILSFIIVSVINLTIFLLFRLIPCKIFWRISEKLRVRVLITFSDMLETMILPVVVYGNMQLFIVHYRMEIMWMYVLTSGMIFFILFTPFFIIAYVHLNRHRQ